MEKNPPKCNNLYCRKKVAAFYVGLFSSTTRTGQSKSLRSRKVCSVEKHNSCLHDVKLSSRNNIFCLVIAFPPTLTQAKRSLLCLQPENGREALGWSWLSSVFCLGWTHDDTPFFRSKVLKAIYFHLKPEKAVLSYQHTRWGRLTKQLPVLVPQQRSWSSHGSHPNLGCVRKV